MFWGNKKNRNQNMQHPAGCFSLITIQKGSVAERGVTSQVIENPTHPYVQMLIESIPVPDPTQKWSTLLTLPLKKSCAAV